MKRHKLLLILILFNCLSSFSQQGIWISKYETKINEEIDYDISNRLLMKISEDSIYFHDAGKMSWDEKFKSRVNYKKRDKKLVVISDSQERYLSMISSDEILIEKDNLVFEKVKKTKVKLSLDKIDSLYFNNLFKISIISNDNDQNIQDSYNTQELLKLNDKQITFNKDLKRENILFYSNVEINETEGCFFFENLKIKGELHPILYIKKNEICFKVVSCPGVDYVKLIKIKSKL